MAQDWLLRATSVYASREHNPLLAVLRAVAQHNILQNILQSRATPQDSVNTPNAACLEKPCNLCLGSSSHKECDLTAKGTKHSSVTLRTDPHWQKRNGQNSTCRSLNLWKSKAKLRTAKRISPFTLYKCSRFLYQLLMLKITICICCAVQILYLWGGNTFLWNDYFKFWFISFLLQCSVTLFKN